MSMGMTVAERGLVTGGFLLLAFAGFWCAFHIALYFVGRRMGRGPK